MTRGRLLRPAAVLAALTAAAAAPAWADPPATAAPPSPTTVFQAGRDGYDTFRLPAIVRTPDSTLLAFAEGRRNSPADFGDIDLVMRRSTDSGRTWGPLRVVADHGAGKVGNPVPVADRRTGRVLLVTTFNSAAVTSADQVLDGEIKDRRVWVQTIGDDGRTWTAPREITAQAKRADWRWYATGPGHGLQIAGGPHDGRIVFCADHSTAPPPGSAETGAEPHWFADHLVYSDDDGGTWHIGAVDGDTADGINANECSAAQTGGQIYVNTRNHNGTDPAHRAAAWSGDGGESFTGPFLGQPALTAPVVEGSVAGLRTGTLVFSAPGDYGSRTDLTLWTSTDSGHTWSKGPVAVPGPSGYSDLVPLSGDTVGVLAEHGDSGPYEQISYLTWRLPGAAPVRPGRR